MSKIELEDMKRINLEVYRFLIRHAFDETIDDITSCNLFIDKISIKDFAIKRMKTYTSIDVYTSLVLPNICKIINDLNSLNIKVNIRDDKYTRNEKNADGRILDGKDIIVKHESYERIETLLEVYLNTFNKNYLIMYLIELIYKEYKECVDCLFAIHASIPYFIIDFKKRYSKNITQAKRTLSGDISFDMRSIY